MRIRLIEAGNELGLGGTELVLENFCRNIDQSQFEVTVVGYKEGGVRGENLRREGFEIIIAHRDPQVWQNILKKCDVLHWHGEGLLDPEVFEPVRQAKPALVIQTNVFGHADFSKYYDVVDVDLYISKMCLIRRVWRDGAKGAAYLKKRSVLYNPVDLSRLRDHMPSQAEVDSFRQDLGLDMALVVGRVGRAVDGKFHPVAIRMMQFLLKWLPTVKFLLVGPTPAMKKLVARLGLEKSFVWVEQTADLRKLLTCYKSMDVFLGPSILGESFGMCLAEAMACGLPIVAVSTPALDNAQVELVDNGRNGLVVEAYPRLVALACRELLLNEALRKKMGEESLRKVENYDAQIITKSLQNIIYQRLGMTYQSQDFESNNVNRLPLSWSQEMESEYTQRLKNLYASPQLRDRLGETGSFMNRVYWKSRRVFSSRIKRLAGLS